MGGTTTCDVWFVYSSISPNNLDQISDTLPLESTGSFEIPLTDLSPQTKYWYRAVADNGVAQGMGDIYEFTTTPTINALEDKTNAKPYNQEKPTNQQNIESKIPPQFRYLIDNHPGILKIIENW